MSKLSHYIKLRNSAIGCDAKQFECDKYLDCDICLEDKIKEHDKQIRADAIDEFMEKICEKYTEEESKGNYKQYCGEIKQNIADIAEQLKVKEQE